MCPILMWSLLQQLGLIQNSHDQQKRRRAASGGHGIRTRTLVWSTNAATIVSEIGKHFHHCAIYREENELTKTFPNSLIVSHYKFVYLQTHGIVFALHK